MLGTKPSGVEWIDKIPISWDIERMKNQFEYAKGLNITKADLIDTGLAVVSYGQIHAKNNSGTTLKDEFIRYISPSNEAITDKAKLCNGDIVFADTSEDYDGLGNAVYMDRDSDIYAGYHTIIAKPKEPKYAKFFAYLFQSEVWRSQLRMRASGIKVYSVTQRMLNDVTIIIPKEEEIEPICSYLDDRCSKIDAIIAEAKASIEEYKEMKQAVIYEAVTKGLEKNSELKIVNNHGIDKVPKSWNKIKLGWFCSFHNGDRSNKYPSGNDFQDYGVPFIGADSLNEIYVNIDKCRYIASKKYEDMGGLKIRRDDILYTLRGSTIGKCAITNFDHGTVASSLTGIRVEKTDKLYPMFLLYWLQSQCEYNQRTILINGATAPNLSAENVGQYNLFIPSLDEQMSIAQFLSNVLGKYNSLLYEKQSLIEDLEAYKKSLIYEVVTGKRKVVA